MSWTLVPTARVDLPVEVDVLLNGSGAYTGPWLETVDIFNVRVSCLFNGGSPTVTVEEGIYTANDNTPKVIRSQNVPVSSLAAYAALSLSARYFRLTVTGGSADNLFQATIRSV